MKLSKLTWERIWIGSLLLLVFLLGATVSDLAHAETWVDVNVGSYHSAPTFKHQGVERKFNQQSWGLGLAHKVSDRVDFKAGVYKNSYYKTSKYVGADLHHRLTPWIRAGVLVGAVTGYRDTPERTWSGLKPVLAPNLTAGTEDVRVVVGYVPKLLGMRLHLTTLQLQFRF